MFCSDDEALLEHVRRLKFHGLGVDAFDRTMQGRSPQAEVLEPGYKYNLPDMAAVLGITQLARVDQFNARRAELAARYREALVSIDGVIPLGVPAYRHKHANHLFIVRVDADRTGLGRDDFMKALKQRNIGTGLHFRAVHLQKYYTESMGMRRGMLPNTEWNSDRICSLPLFPDMTFQDINDVVDSIREVLANERD
jgi:UDP-4-amino-4-deoxy-L-arabinose-oxoglutarate aminotransferase